MRDELTPFAAAPNALLAVCLRWIDHYAYSLQPSERLNFRFKGTTGRLLRSGALLDRRIGQHLLMILKSPLVLVVEDEGLIRLNLVDELEDAGFRVIEASNADEALKALDSRPDIQAIFTDIDMPGSIDGLRFATTVRQSQPRMPILLTSGYLKIAKNELPLEMPFLSKPYEVGQVVNHLRELIPG